MENSLVAILLAMAIGLVAGFEVGQHLMRKRFAELVRQAAEAATKEAQVRKEEQEKRKKELMDSIEQARAKWKLIFEKAKEQKTYEPETGKMDAARAESGNAPLETGENKQ